MFSTFGDLQASNLSAGIGYLGFVLDSQTLYINTDMGWIPVAVNINCATLYQHGVSDI